MIYEDEILTSVINQDEENKDEEEGEEETKEESAE